MLQGAVLFSSATLPERPAVRLPVPRLRRLGLPLQIQDQVCVYKDTRTIYELSRVAMNHSLCLSLLYFLNLMATAGEFVESLLEAMERTK